MGEGGRGTTHDSPRQRATSNKVTLKESQPTLSLEPWPVAELGILTVYHKTSKDARALWVVLARPVASSHIGSDAKCATVLSRVTQEWVGVTGRAVSKGALCLRTQTLNYHFSFEHQLRHTLTEYLSHVNSTLAVFVSLLP